MRRGRVLNTVTPPSLSRDQTNQDGATRTPEQPAAQPPPPEAARPSRPLRGRIITQLPNLSRPVPQATTDTPAQIQLGPDGDVPNQPAAPVRPPRPDSPDPNSSTNSSVPIGKLSRQGSDLSRTSALTEQFAELNISDLKVKLDKKPSEAGQPCNVSVNYMEFKTDPSCVIAAYHVYFDPNIESVGLRYRLLRSPEALINIGDVMHWTGTNLYLPRLLGREPLSFTTPHPGTGDLINVKIVYVKTPPNCELLPFYNSLMHRVLDKMEYTVINRHHYSSSLAIAIDHLKLTVWPGWITSIQELDGGLKLSVDSSFRILRQSTVRELIMNITRNNMGGNIKEVLEAHLIGTIVMATYSKKPYRIDGLDLTKKPTDTFTYTRGGVERQISYVDYMREHWQEEVYDKNQPMIIHRPKQKRGYESDEVCLLIPEFCLPTGLTDDMRSNFSIMKAIAEHTRLPPDQRKTKLEAFLLEISNSSVASKVLSDWGLSVSKDTEKLQARRLPAESVHFGNDRSSVVPENADWTRSVMSGPVFKGKELENWVFIYVETDLQIAEEVLNTMREVCRFLNLKINPPRRVVLKDERTLSYTSAGKKEVRPTDQMVVILTPKKSQREDRYNACKKLFSCDIPVPCQFIRAGVVGDPRRMKSIVQKIVIQVLSKIGGEPWGMKFPMKSFMIVGIDVYHDTRDRSKSCVGFVASMNEFTSRWWSRTFFQNSLEEIGQKLKVCMGTALRKYHTLNGQVPQRVIIYRDGVGDGQMSVVVESEVSQVKDAITFYMRDSGEDQEEPQLSYLIVQKRINAKLMLHQAERVVNPLPGTYLDHTITHPEYNDFYLVSQHVNQGTVSPTKYVILTETGTLKPTQHQKLAYKMTHMYYNWCGTVRVPAPCQYAHKLAYLTGQNIRAQANDRMEDKLYYL